MINILTTNTPLGPNGVLSTAWLDVTGNGDFPYVYVTANADQAGSFVVLESEATPQADTQQLSGSVVLAGQTVVATAPVNRRYVRVVYTNGALAQSTFALNIWTSVNPVLSQTRILELILREIRAQNSILLSMKEPTGVQVNIPAGAESTSS